jgi:hypothetical protein
MSLLDLIHWVGGFVPPRIRRLDIFRRPYERAVIVRNFERAFGRPPDLKAPTTFSEKIIYKMMFDRRPILTRITDKLRAREYVAERIGARYLTELYQVCRSPAEIDWHGLPRRFVIKATHGTAMNIFVRDKSAIDVPTVSARLETWLAQNLYHCYREWAYRDIPPAILIEEMLIEDSGALAANWKFFTFDGRAEFLRVDLDWHGRPAINNYDRDLTRLHLRGRYQPNAITDPKFPANIELMFSLADRLGSGLDFVRVDLYNVNGRIVFGELTNYPAAGLDPFYPAEFDAVFGSKWRVPARYEQG